MGRTPKRLSLFRSLGSSRHQRGLTLIEVIVTMTVLAICTAIAIPSYQALIRRQRVDATMHLLTTYMASARITAITRGSRTVVCPSDGKRGCRQDSDWTYGWLLFLDRDGNGKMDDPGDILREERAPGDAAMRILSNRKQLRYLPDGSSAGGNLTLQVCYDNLLKGKIVVSNPGRVRSERPKGEVPC
ncbi:MULTISPECIES: GspH/FimT family pseudopilin [unclassified Pseudoxanthomonas]|uniref:GspH/FimT family pseudopilin n=1 Tax=unclassified Pseudoxanthomonas TaxID=2645906 RepID=UPI00307828F5